MVAKTGSLLPHLLDLLVEHLEALSVQLFRLLLLGEQVLAKLSLLFVLRLKVVQLYLVLLLAAVFRADRHLQLVDLDRLHVDGVLELQGLLLQEQVRITRIVQLATHKQNLLL